MAGSAEMTSYFIGSSIPPGRDHPPRQARGRKIVNARCRPQRSWPMQIIRRFEERFGQQNHTAQRGNCRHAELDLDGGRRGLEARAARRTVAGRKAPGPR